MVIQSDGGEHQWAIHEVEYKHNTIAEICGLAHSPSNVCDAAPPAEPPASASHKDPQAEDFSFLDTSFHALDLDFEKSAAGREQNARAAGDADDSDCVEGDDYLTDAEGPDDIDMDQALLEQHVNVKKRKQPPDADAADVAHKPPDAGHKAPESPKSVAGSEGSGSRIGQVKTIATDKERVESALRAVGRPGGFSAKLFISYNHIIDIISYQNNIISISNHESYPVLLSYWIINKSYQSYAMG